MLSNKMNVLQLAALMRAHGINDVVLCPGSRDIPLTQTLSHIPDFRCYSLTDERSAGFFALGLAVQRSVKVAVVVTSGSALANLHPAVCEAFYQQVPLLVISADRPEAWIGQMDGQTMPQPNLFQSLVRKAVSLPEVHDEESLWYCNRLINEALLELDHGVLGPVHINVPISDPFFDFSVEQLPEARVIRRLSLADFKAWLEQHKAEFERVLLVVGQNNAARWGRFEGCGKGLCAFQVFSELPSNFAYWAQACSSELLDETGSEYYQQAAFTGKHLDWLLTELEASCSCDELEAWTPQVVVSVGGHIVSKKLKQFLRKYPPQYHILVNARGEVSDVFKHLTHVVEADGAQVLSILSSSLEPRCCRYAERMAELYRAVLPQPLWGAQGTLAQRPQHSCQGLNFLAHLLERIPAGSTLHLGNSSSLRLAEFAPVTHLGDIKVQCNRGINGIEGSVSAAVGAAYLDYVQACAEQGQIAEQGLAADGAVRPTACPLHFLVIGDLSFYYDFNGLWHSQLPPNLRIVLLNNSGGEIFRVLPGLKLDRTADALVRGVHHSPSLALMQPRLEAMGINYLEVGTVQEAWGQETQDVALKETQMQQALTQLLHPWDEHSSLTLVEYHATPQESEFFTESISFLRTRVREYLSAARSGER